MRGNILHSSDLLPNDRIVSYSRREETKQYFKHHQEHASSFCIQVGCFLDLTCTCAPFAGAFCQGNNETENFGCASSRPCIETKRRLQTDNIESIK